VSAGAGVIAVVVLFALACDLIAGRVKPYRAHRPCGGRGYCAGCNYTGKVLTWAGWVTHHELRRK
jgi:hypothetical protein